MRCFTVALAFCVWTASAQTTPESLKVITYNVQFLPGIAASQNKRPNAEYRATRIAQEVNKFDVVALEETFEVKHRDAIKAAVKSAWNNQFASVESPKPDGFVTSGGCLLMTRLPIVASDSVVYTHFSSPKEYGLKADGFAAKGAIWARVARSDAAKGDFVDVFVTHLEARAPDVRPFQYQELADFIKAKSDPNRPVLLFGDLNTNGVPAERKSGASQYAIMTKALNGARDGIVDTWVNLMGEKLGCTTEQESTETGKRIDYIFFSNPKPPAPQVQPKSILVNGYLDSQVTALSDHSAVTAEFAWPVAK